jgi:hypothetical protein
VAVVVGNPKRPVIPGTIKSDQELPKKPVQRCKNRAPLGYDYGGNYFCHSECPAKKPRAINAC